MRASPLAQVDHRIGGLLDPEPLGQGGSQQQAGVGDGVGVVKQVSSWSRVGSARGVVGFEGDPRCLLAAVDRGDAASIAGGCL